MNKGKAFYAIQIIIKDITERKLKELEMKKRFMRFELEDGNTYITKETRPAQAIQAFRELLAAGYAGTVITRDSKKEYDKSVEKIYGYVKVSDTKQGDLDKITTGKIIELISGLPRKEVVLIDCLEYCASRNGTRKTLKMVQDIRDLAIEKRLIVLISVNPSALPEKDLSMIENETKNIHATKFMARLPAKLLETLDYIDRENSDGRRPSYSDIGAHFEISKPTTRTRVGRLVREGAVKEFQKGRQKVLELTEKGKSYLAAQ
ncbi:MAG: DUF835 domain-containing protein [Thermoplasmata archaeon]